ncbi:MAG: cytochrome c [Proteobacteria bacterium]|nr:cytochrome c [Pseudomonadota bacterium]MCP4916933.1 cytochrome c [Pseudomonadota bacterium]
MTFFLFAALTACGSDTPEPAAEPAPAPEPVAEPAPAPEPAAFDAKAAFEQVCGVCHGAGGAGDGVAGAALDPKPANFTDAAFWTDERTDEVLFKAIKEGGGAVGKSPLMAPYGGQYDDAQITAMVEHIKTMRPAQ